MWELWLIILLYTVIADATCTTSLTKMYNSLILPDVPQAGRQRQSLKVSVRSNAHQA